MLYYQSLPPFHKYRSKGTLKTWGEIEKYLGYPCRDWD